MRHQEPQDPVCNQAKDEQERGRQQRERDEADMILEVEFLFAPSPWGLGELALIYGGHDNSHEQQGSDDPQSKEAPTGDQGVAAMMDISKGCIP